MLDGERSLTKHPKLKSRILAYYKELYTKDEQAEQNESKGRLLLIPTTNSHERTQLGAPTSTHGRRSHNGHETIPIR